MSFRKLEKFSLIPMSSEKFSISMVSVASFNLFLRKNIYFSFFDCQRILSKNVKKGLRPLLEVKRILTVTTFKGALPFWTSLLNPFVPKLFLSLSYFWKNNTIQGATGRSNEALLSIFPMSFLREPQ